MSDANGNGVNYTVKELIARVEAKLDAVLVQISTKSDKSELDLLHTRVSSLERSTTAHDAVRASYKWMFGLASGNILSLGALALKIFHII